MARDKEQVLDRFLEPLRRLAFVQAVDVEHNPQHAAERATEAKVKLTTPRRTFRLVVELKRTYLDRTTVNALVAQQTYFRNKLNTPLLLVARYIPAGIGERLAQAGINFVDAVGNIHLNLGGDYYVFVIGRKQAKPQMAERRITAAMVQVTFTLLVEKDAIDWPVRKLAEAAGVGKTAAAEARQRLTQRGMVQPTRTGLTIANRKDLQQDFLTGYEQVLRPDLLIGTFRPLEPDPDLLLGKFKKWAKRNNVQWAVTGGPAAFALDQFYRGEQVPIFLANAPDQLNRQLKLLRDTNGTVTLLKMFGTLFPWRVQNDLPIAHPLLIYADLLHQGDPRALEAAAQIQERHLIQ
jgi:hypothetical protein